MESDGEDLSAFADAGPDDEFDGDIDALATAFMARANASAPASPNKVGKEDEQPRRDSDKPTDDLLTVEAERFFEAAEVSPPLPASAMATPHVMQPGTDASPVEDMPLSEPSVSAGSLPEEAGAEEADEKEDSPKQWPDLTFTDGRVISRRKRSVDETTELEPSKKDSDMATACKEEEALRYAPLDESFNAQRAIYYCNRAACHLQLADAEEALYDCDRALELNATYNKALARRAAAMEKLEKLDEALADMELWAKTEPTSVPAQQGIERLKKLITERDEKLKEEMLGKLKDMGNWVLGKFGLSVDNFKAVQDPQTGSYSISFQK